ncbi:MAG TPA: MFS transporter [bacterium]|nr:MFS transporter [bacterium]
MTSGPDPLQRLRRHVIDTAPLREFREFRLLWIGQSVSNLGNRVTQVALAFQVYQLTGSSLAVGLLALARVVPLLACSLLGGAIADAVDRRRWLLWAQTAAAAGSLALAVNTFASPRLWAIYALTAALAAVRALYSPGLGSLVPLLVPRAQLPAALALNSVYGTATSLVGPVLGGVLIARLGVGGAYLVDVGTYTAALAALAAMTPVPPVRGTPPPGLGSIREALRFLKGRPVLQSTFLVDLNAMIFGMPTSLFPALAARAGGGAQALGLLYAAPYAGALLASLLSGGVGRVRRQGQAVIVAVFIWGAAIAAFGFARSLWLMAVFLILAGAADFVSAVFRDTIAQTVVPDAMRGRLSGMEQAVVASGPEIGDIEAGVVASLVSIPFSIISGGLACMVGVGALALAVPQFHRYDTRRPTP